MPAAFTRMSSGRGVGDLRCQLVERGPMGDVAGRLAGQIDDVDLCAAFAQQLRDRAADTRRTARHDRDPALHASDHARTLRRPRTSPSQAPTVSTGWFSTGV